MPDPEPQPRPRPRRERSVRYPGVSLSEAVEFCRRMESKGLDGLMAEAIAAGLGFGNIKTNTFSARLSAARQFGLLTLSDELYAMTPIARGLLHPLDEREEARLRRRALASPPLYAELINRLAGRKVPEPPALANLLYHQFQISAAAREAAAEAFLASARFAGVLGPDGVLRPEGPESEGAGSESPPPPAAAAPLRPPEASAPAPIARSNAPSTAPSPVRIDLRLWGADAGKILRVRAPESMTAASFERLLQALRLHIRIEPDNGNS